MTLPCSDVTSSLGAYVLGALCPPQRAEVEDHLAGCPACRDELGSLAPLPGLMSRLTLDEVLTGPPPVDDAMLERLLSAAARERRTATRHRWIASAAAVVVLAGGSAGGALAWQAAQGSPWQQVAAADSGAVHVSVQLADQAGGTRVHMTLTGVRSDERCSLVAISRTGRSEVAGWWAASYSGTAQMTGTTSIPRSQLATLQVVTDAGKTLAVVPV
jgi:hypothetical protein